MSKKGLAKKLIISIILLAITFVLFMAQCNIIKVAENTLPKGVVLTSSNDMSLSFEDVKNANEEVEDTSCTQNNIYVMPGEEKKENNEVKNIAISGVGITKAQLTGELSNEMTDVNIMLTDGKYADIVPIDMLIGKYFSVSNVPEENKFIVISDTLAIKYFKKYDVLGFNLLINQQEYTVCGVYRSNSSLVSKLSSNGLDNVYMPYSGMLNYEKIPANFILAKTNTNFVQSITDKIIKNSGKTPYPEIISNYSDTLALVKQSKSITIFLCGLVLVITLFILLISQLKTIYQSYKKEECKRDILIKSGIGLSFFVGIILLCFLIKFKIYFPANMLPSDNIFDIKFYTETVVSSIQKSNNIQLYDFHLNFANKSMAFSAIEAFFTFISFLTAYIYVMVNMRQWIKKR